MTEDTSRPLLRWESRHQFSGRWAPSNDNPYWRPPLTHFPDTRLLEAGDILLFEPENPTLIQRAIQNYQAGLFTHAAVYLQADNTICEATFNTGKVTCGHLDQLLRGRCLLVRRVKDVDTVGRREAAKMAVTLLNEPYNFWPIVANAIDRLTPIKHALKDPTALMEPLVCSTLCEHAIMAANLGIRSVTRRKGHAVMPEDLASTDILEDVHLTWRYC